MADIYNTASNTLLSGTSGNDSIQNGGWWDDGSWHDCGSYVTINAGKGNDYIESWGDSVTIDAGGGNDDIDNDGSEVTIDAGAGNDYIFNDGSEVTIDAGAGSDSIDNEGSDVSIDGGSGNDYIESWGDSVTIKAGAGDDTIYTRGEHTTVAGGKGNDSIRNDGRTVLFVYADGDGDDTIEGFTSGCKLKIGSGKSSTYSKEIIGSDIILTVGDGKITLVGAAYLDTPNIIGTEIETDSWTLDGTTATYGSLTVKGVKSLNGLSVSGKIVTVSAASLGTEKISVSDGYTLALGDDVSSSTTKKSWTLKNSTATYKQTTTAGYSLDDNEIIYSKKSSKTLATVKGVTSLDGLSVSKKIVSVSAASLDTKKVTVSDGYTLALGSDVSGSTTKKSWTLKNSTATYKQTTTAGYSLVDNEIIYTKKSSTTLATVKGVTDKSGLKVSGKTIKLSGDALSKKVSVSGAYTFDFASDYSKATITGSSSSDTILARGKNIFVTSGAGADIFEFKSTGTISDYEEADKISLSSAANISVSGSDLIFNGKLTVAGAADKIVTYIEGGVEKIFKPATDDVRYNAAGTAATLTATYEEDTFAANSKLATINASAVNYGLSIIGNKRANKITGTSEDDYIDGQGSGDTLIGGGGNDSLVGGAGNDCLSGGKGNDSLWGGAGDDTLLGGGGKDIFIYRDGDGDDIISGYESIDIIKIFSDNEVNAPTTDAAGNVTFKIGGGQITFENAADKYIELFIGDSNNTYDKKYRPAGK